MTSPILRATARVLTPAILILSVLVFWRGHNAPGGGFVGGLLAAAAVALVEKAEGRARASRLLVIEPGAIAAIGLACALAAGVWGGLAAGIFLKGMWPFYHLGLPFGSIMLFDFGVYLVVLGTICAVLFAFEDEISGGDPWK